MMPWKIRSRLMNNKCIVLPHEWYYLSPLEILVVPEWYHLVLWLVPFCTMNDTMLIPEWYHLASWFILSYSWMIHYCLLNDTILCPEWLPPDLSGAFSDNFLPHAWHYFPASSFLNDTALYSPMMLSCPVKDTIFDYHWNYREFWMTYSILNDDTTLPLV